jgi:hypothetical protein
LAHLKLRAQLNACCFKIAYLPYFWLKNKYIGHTKTISMLTILLISKLILAFSILVVWVFRFENIVLEFQQYGLSNLTRTAVGSLKISLATLLVASIWYPDLVLVPAALMAALMLSAQYFHFRVRNPFHKYLPSIGLFCLSFLLVAVEMSWV